MKRGLNMLQTIKLKNCSLTTLHPRTFGGLHNLKLLDLSHNLLVQFPSYIFQSIPHIEHLVMAGNSLSKIKQMQFQHLTGLDTLDLSNCSIYHIQEKSFESLTNLTKLFLHENKLTVLSHPEEFPQSLLTISLQDNPWSCDCKLSQLRLWMAGSKAEREVEPICYSPGKLFGYRIEVLSLTEFACLPTVSPSSMFVSIPARNNASLVCTVTADPSSEVSWSFNGSPVLNKISRVRIMTSFIGNGNTRSELILTNVTRINNGTYTCVAKNNAGIATADYVINIEEQQSITSKLGIDSHHFLLVLILIVILFLIILALSLICLLKDRCNKKKSPSEKSQPSDQILSTKRRSGIQMGKSTIPPRRIKRDKRSSGYLCGHSCMKPDIIDDYYMNNLACTRSCKRKNPGIQPQQHHIPCISYPVTFPFTPSYGPCVFLGRLDTQCAHYHKYDPSNR